MSQRGVFVNACGLGFLRSDRVVCMSCCVSLTWFWRFGVVESVHGFDVMVQGKGCLVVSQSRFEVELALEGLFQGPTLVCIGGAV